MNQHQWKRFDPKTEGLSPLEWCAHYYRNYAKFYEGRDWTFDFASGFEWIAGIANARWKEDYMFGDCKHPARTNNYSIAELEFWSDAMVEAVKLRQLHMF